MTYVPPSGWVETRTAAVEGSPITARFHIRRDCVRIEGGALRQVDKPYSAARCPLCAGDTSSRQPSSAVA